MRKFLLLFILLLSYAIQFGCGSGQNDCNCLSPSDERNILNALESSGATEKEAHALLADLKRKSKKTVDEVSKMAGAASSCFGYRYTLTSKCKVYKTQAVQDYLDPNGGDKDIVLLYNLGSEFKGWGSSHKLEKLDSWGCRIFDYHGGLQKTTIKKNGKTYQGVIIGGNWRYLQSFSQIGASFQVRELCGPNICYDKRVDKKYCDGGFLVFCSAQRESFRQLCPNGCHVIGAEAICKQRTQNCSGFCCGKHPAGNYCDGNALVSCSNDKETKRIACAYGCLQNPSGQHDACKNPPPPTCKGFCCDKTPSGRYCNGNDLVDCLNGGEKSRTSCPHGCLQNPSGQHDACKGALGPRCGDKKCDSNENCSSCSQDCGQCPSTQGQIQAKYKTSKCIHMKEGKWRNGDALHLWDCSAGPDHIKTWLYDAKSGLIKAKHNTTKCLHMKEGKWKNGDALHLWDCNAGPNHMKTWSYDSQSGQIRARHKTSKCIHMKEGKWRNGDALHLWDCSAGPAHMKSWYLK